MTENVDLSKLERVLASLAEASPAARREGLAPYATRAGIGRLMSMATAGGKNARAAARALCDLSSSKASGAYQPLYGFAERKDSRNAQELRSKGS